MKKIFVFLMTILATNILSLINVSAATNTFYEGDYIGDIYMTKEKGGVKYYQRARFFNMTNRKKEAYCIEPFAMFNENGSYALSLTADNLSSEQMKRIQAIINFGYLYSYHYDPKWYAITQFMVWQVADPTGDYYFTNGLNGSRITRFESEMAEINSLVNEYYTIPSIANTNIDIVKGKDLTLTDTNNVLSKYKSDSDKVTIDGNNLIIKDLDEGNNRIHLYRKEVRTTQIPFFYNSPDSQNMATSGDLEQLDIYLNINVVKTRLEITKIDSDNKNTTPRGDAKLEKAKYELLDKDKNKISELEISKNMKASIENLDFGKYYLREIEAGIGYKIDDKIYEINIDKDNPVISIELENKVIEKEIELIKYIEDSNSFSKEEGIGFDIIDSNNKLYDTITTDKNGIAKIKLPYGKYLIKQRNTTAGYNLIDDFNIDVLDNIKLTKELYDYKIKVPNTYHEENNYSLILLILMGLIYVKKMVFC